MEYENFIEYQRTFLPFGVPALTLDDLWHFEFLDEWKEEILRSATFFTAAIQQQQVYLSVETRLFFSSDVRVNAKAVVYQDRGAIVWNAGLLLKQLEILKQSEQIDAVLHPNMRLLLLPKLDNDPSILFYQFTQSFTFYHELAHIVQAQNLETAEFLEVDAEPVLFEFARHQREVDADEFASVLLTSHIAQYASNHFHNIDRPTLTSLIAFFTVPVLYSFITIHPDQVDNVEIQSGSHPHPLFRLLFIAGVITTFINQQHEELGIHIDLGEVMDTSLEVVSSLTAIDLVSLWAERSAGLMDYMRLIRNSPFPAGYRSAIDAWNNEIRARE